MIRKLSSGWLHALTLLLILVPATLLADSTKIDRQFDVDSGQELGLALDNVRGDISIEGWDQDRVEVTGRIRGRDWRDDDELEFEQSDAGIDVSTSFRVRGGEQVKVSLTIKVPREFNIRIEAAADTEIKNLRGDIDLSVGNANVKLENVHGGGRISNANGRMSIRDCNLDGDISNVNGSLRIDKSDIKGEVATTNGNMRISRASDGIELSSTNGNIRVGMAGDHVRAETVNGKITIDELDGWI